MWHSAASAALTTAALVGAIFAAAASAGVIEVTPATITAALDAANPGDVLLLADGVYPGDQWLRRSGTAEAPIVVRAAGEGAIFDGGDTCLRVEGASHVIVEGIRFQNATVAGMRVRMGDLPFVEHVTVRDCVFANNAKWGIITSHANFFTIETCETFGATIEHGIYVANSGDDNVIRNNRVHHNVGNGIHINGDPSCGGDGVMSRTLVEGNVIWENGRRGGSAMSVMHVQDSIFRNNLIYGNHSAGFVFFWYVGDEATQSSKNNQVYNNTVYFRPGEGRSCLLMRNSATGNVVRNNIFVGGQRGVVFVEPSCMEGLTMDNNVIVNHPGARLIGDRDSSVEAREGAEYVRPLDAWRAQGFEPITTAGIEIPLEQWLAKGHDANSVFGVMPSFVNAAGEDFRLAAGSVGIDMGTDLGALAPVDIDGTARPQGKAYDCGCYEAPAVE